MVKINVEFAGMHTLLVGLMAGVLMSGPMPTGADALIKNPLYKTGRMTAACEELPLTGGDFDTVRLYVGSVTKCLDRAWGAQVKKAGMSYRKPKVVLEHGERVRTPCGVYYPERPFSLYCGRTIYLMVTDTALRNEPDHPRILESLAIGYGYHVQNEVGILGQQARASKKLSKSEDLALVTKVSLQNICLAGVFLGSAWDSLGHTKALGPDLIIEWQAVYGYQKGYGQAKNRVYWERRGFDAESPDACNTFKAPAARVK